MQKTAKITSFQFYSILFLSRVFALVSYVSGVRKSLSSTDEVIAVAVACVFLLVASIPTMLFIRKDGTPSILTRASCISPVLEKCIAAVYLVSIVYTGIVTASRFELMIGSLLFPETGVLVFVAAMLFAAAYGAYRGIESIGRSAVIYLIPVLGALVFVFATLINKFDVLNFTPVYTSEIPDMFDSAYYFCARTGELGAVLLLLPDVKNHSKKHMYNWIFALSAVVIVTELMVSGVLGGFGENQLFNMYSLSVLAKFGFVERLDAIISCIWLICAGVKMSMIFYICNLLLSSILNKKRKLVYISASAVAVFAGAAVISVSILRFSEVVSSPLTVIMFTFTIVVMPLAVMAAEKIKEKRNEKA
ncbi:MAG: GerAB/ArcD/ProY family transporter [Clostridia bacterium]|nr:GerAB/ArcD/ProY family transporter [Clostridia bacterium]